jgi:hypothetical protein
MKKIKKGDIAKHRSWIWGGSVQYVTETTAYILVGNNETGHVYKSPLMETELKNAATGVFESVEKENYEQTI